MNAPFKIEEILADAAVGITDLKRNPAAVIAEAKKRQVAILNRNRPVAYLISPDVWEYVNDILVDVQLYKNAAEELDGDNADNVEIDIDQYL